MNSRGLRSVVKISNEVTLNQLPPDSPVLCLCMFLSVPHTHTLLHTATHIFSLPYPVSVPPTSLSPTLYFLHNIYLLSQRPTLWNLSMCSNNLKLHLLTLLTNFTLSHPNFQITVIAGKYRVSLNIKPFNVHSSSFNAKTSSADNSAGNVHQHHSAGWHLLRCLELRVQKEQQQQKGRDIFACQLHSRSKNSFSPIITRTVTFALPYEVCQNKDIFQRQFIALRAT